MTYTNEELREMGVREPCLHERAQYDDNEMWCPDCTYMEIYGRVVL